jgi:hypothetical protein
MNRCEKEVYDYNNKKGMKTNLMGINFLTTFGPSSDRPETFVRGAGHEGQSL